MITEDIFEHTQQIAAEWSRVVTAGVTQLEAVAAELGELQSRTVTQLVDAWDEAGKRARQSFVEADKIASAWRKLALDGARRTAEILTPPTAGHAK